MKWLTKRVQLMGTFIEIGIYHDEPAPVLEEAFRQLQYYITLFSAHNPHSELMRLNHMAGIAPIPVSHHLYHLISIGKNESLIANSHLNIAIGPLVKLWQIGSPHANLPSHDAIQKALCLSLPNHILLDKDTQSVFLTQKGMEIDLGALAKGYIADKISAFLQTQQTLSGFINLGGNLLTFGPALHHQDHLWRVGIRQPSHKKIQNAVILKLRDKSIVTSGTYERFFTKNKKRYHHILDPKTGYPISSNMASLTVLSKTGLDGECLTSRFFGHKPSLVMADIHQFNNVETIIISEQNQLFVSPSLENKIIWTHPRYRN